MADTRIQFTLKADTAEGVAALEKMRVQMESLGKETKGSGDKLGKLGGSIPRFLSDPLGSAKDALLGVCGGLSGLVAGVIAVGTALFSFAKSQANAWEQMNNLAAMTGRTVSELQALKQITKEMGMEGMDFGRTLSFINMQMGKEEGKPFQNALEAMGIDTGGGRDAIDMLDDLRVKLLAIPNSSERAQVGLQVLGIRYRELLPLLLNSTSGLRDQIVEMEKSAVVWDKLTQKHLAQFDKILDSISRKIAIIKATVTAEIAGILTGNASPVANYASDSKGILYGVAKNVTDSVPQATGAVINFNLALAKVEENAKKAKEATEQAAKSAKEMQDAYNETVSAMPAQLSEMLHEISDDMKVLSIPFEAVAKNASDAQANIERMAKSIKDELIPNALDVPEWLTKPAAPESGPNDSAIVAEMKAAGDAAEKAAEIAKKGSADIAREISTIFDDWTKGMADALLNWQGMWSAMAGVMKSTASNILRLITSDLMAPLQKQMQGIGKSFSGIFTGKTSTDHGSSGLDNVDIPGVTGGNGKSFFSNLLSSAGPMMAMTAASMALQKAIPALINAIKGKTSGQAGSMEVGRDFGGLNVNEDEFKTYYESLGLTDATAWGIRKDISAAPKYLIETLYPLAQAQGKVGAFLQSLESIKTSWGTFNFRAAFELGNSTGDWTELNNQFVAAFKNSQALQSALPNWQDLLLGTSKAVTELESLQQTMADLAKSSKTMYDNFLSTGEITKEFSDQIEKLGGNVADFSDMAGLVKNRNFIDSLKQELQSLLPDNSPLAKLMAGNFDETVIDSLKSAGLDPEKFKKLAGFGAMANWDQIASDFKSTGKLTDPLKQALLQFGGAAGQSAVSRYGQGFNTVTDKLLADTKAAMDLAYQGEVKNLLGDLQTAEDKTTSAIETMSANICAEIDKMIDVLKGGTVIGSGSNAGMVGAGGGGGGNYVEPSRSSLPPIEVNFHGDVYGQTDFEAKIAQAVTTVYRAGGFAFLNA